MQAEKTTSEIQHNRKVASGISHSGPCKLKLQYYASNNMKKNAPEQMSVLDRGRITAYRELG